MQFVYLALKNVEEVGLLSCIIPHSPRIGVYAGQIAFEVCYLIQDTCSNILRPNREDDTFFHFMERVPLNYYVHHRRVCHHTNWYLIFDSNREFSLEHSLMILERSMYHH